MKSYWPIALVLLPLYMLGVKSLGGLITRRMKDGRVKYFLLRRVGPK